MKHTLKLLGILLVMVGCYQAQFPQKIADAWNKYGANQQEKTVLVHVAQENFENDPAYIEWCIVNDKHPDCNPLEPRNPRHSGTTLGHWD
ncbi:hypothetical protein [Bartonella massiliensis]|uniref:hypothetical protein n=1 Tax=Bartonella massiliensis TaxID=929795 RepID=UPI00115B7F29|nr:hypothetical protein [Bartonella massiliensis]